MPKEYAKKSPPRKNPIRYTPIQFIPRAGIYVILFHFNLKQTRHIRLREVNLQRLAVVIVMEHITAGLRVNAAYFRHPLVIEHVTEVIDRVVRDYGVGYI